MNIDSVPYGWEIEQIRINHPSLYNFHDGDVENLIKMGRAYATWLKDLEFIKNSHFEQIENPYSFEYTCHMYMGEDLLTMQEAYERGIVVEGTHPYHWRYSKQREDILFLGYKQIPGLRVLEEEHAFLFDESLSHGTEVYRFDVLNGRDNTHQTANKTRHVMVTGGAHTFQYGASFIDYEHQPKEVTSTVRTNGRQKIMDNGKHQWPSAKQRKGHR